MNRAAELTPLQRRALQVMNIDVYVTREATSHVTRDAKSRGRRPQASHAPVATALAGAATDTSADAGRARSDAVALDCLAAAGVVAIGTFVSAADTRFVHDVLAALVGSDTRLRKSAFKWPQTQTGERSRAAAEQAYAGFLSGQTERAGARLLLLLGPAATMLLPAQRADAGYVAVECAAVEDLRRDPAQKKLLWLSIRRFSR